MTQYVEQQHLDNLRNNRACRILLENGGLNFEACRQAWQALSAEMEAATRGSASWYMAYINYLWTIMEAGGVERARNLLAELLESQQLQRTPVLLYAANIQAATANYAQGDMVKCIVLIEKAQESTEPGGALWAYGGLMHAKALGRLGHDEDALALLAHVQQAGHGASPRYNGARVVVEHMAQRYKEAKEYHRRGTYVGAKYFSLYDELQEAESADALADHFASCGDSKMLNYYEICRQSLESRCVIRRLPKPGMVAV